MEALVFRQQRRPVEPIIRIALQPLQPAGGNDRHMQRLAWTKAPLQQGGQSQQGGETAKAAAALARPQGRDGLTSSKREVEERGELRRRGRGPIVMRSARPSNPSATSDDGAAIPLGALG